MKGFKVMVPLLNQIHQHLVSLLDNEKFMVGTLHDEKMSRHILALCV
jgi:hypothetical protein